MFEKCGVMPKKKLTKFLVTDNAVLQPGTPLHATHFRPGDYVDISGYTLVENHFLTIQAPLIRL